MSYDAIIVGSGATGGWAAKELTEQGLRVLVLEAGPALKAEDLPDLRTTALPLPGAPSVEELRSRYPVASNNVTFGQRTAHLFVDEQKNPYSTPTDKPFYWIRGRHVGGRTVNWRAVMLRFSDYELKAASRDGFGDDWPISYSDLAPYYDRVEEFLEVRGSTEDLPQLPAGRMAAQVPFTHGERIFKEAVEQRWPERRVIGIRGIDPDARLHIEGTDSADWPAFTSNGTTLAAARKTGRMTLRTDAVVSHLVVDGHTGRARGVAFVDRLTGRAEEAFAPLLMMCASGIETARILLHSKSPQHPAGLGNSSDVLGRYLMDSVMGGVLGVVPALAAEQMVPEFTWGSRGFYIPKFRNVFDRHPDFIRGYGVQGSAQRPLTVRLFDGIPFNLNAMMEMLPRPENRVTLDPELKDAWGIPAVRIECSHSDNERAMAKDALATVKEMAAAAGFQVLKEVGPLPPGTAIHEMGTARMGSDPKTSVLNPFNQCWDSPNVYVTDGSCFVSRGCQNPTGTMMALTVRACDHAVAQLKRGEL